MSKKRTLCSLLAVVMVAASTLPSAAYAEQAASDEEPAEADPLADLRRQMDQGEYRRARATATAVIEAGGLNPPQLSEAYQALAICNAAMRRRDDARDAFVKVLAIDRDYTLPKTASPLLRRPFKAAVAFWSDKQRPEIRLDPQERLLRGDVFVVEPEFQPGDLEGFVTEITLHLRQPDGSFATYIGVDGRIDIAPGELEGLSTVEYYVAGRDEHGNVVISAGSPAEPFRLALIDPEPEPPPEPVEPAPPPRERRQWYREWWVWTIVGVAVAGLATGITLGVTDLDPSVCARAIDEECDYTATIIP